MYSVYNSGILRPQTADLLDILVLGPVGGTSPLQSLLLRLWEVST